MTYEKPSQKRQECAVYSRVVGWITPLKSWNKGKAAEWADRTTYKMSSTTKKV